MEAYAIISIQTASPALDFQCLVFLTDELKTQLLHTGYIQATLAPVSAKEIAAIVAFNPSSEVLESTGF